MSLPPPYFPKPPAKRRRISPSLFPSYPALFSDRWQCHRLPYTLTCPALPLPYPNIYPIPQRCPRLQLMQHRHQRLDTRRYCRPPHSPDELPSSRKTNGQVSKAAPLAYTDHDRILECELRGRLHVLRNISTNIIDQQLILGQYQPRSL
jgi:hypothetical protein